MSLRGRLGAALSALAVAALTLVAGPRPAHAWVDVNVEADDVRVTLDRSGDARVEHRITLKIAGGPLRSLDVRGVDADAAPDPEGYVVPQKEAARGSLASAQGVAAERILPDARPRPDGAPALTVLRVRFDPDKGLGRGVYVLLVRYTTHLRAVVDGSLARVVWRGPVWEDGFDSARVTFDLPAAPTEPRADDPEPGGAPGSVRAPLVLSTVRRGVSRDQIELLRPYAAKGEAVAWAIRADARAFQVAAPAPPGRAESVRAAVDGALGEPAQRALLGLGALSLFLLYASLVALKSVETARHARAAGAAPRPLIRLPIALRAILAGAALVAGVFVQIVFLRATAGALLVLAAVLCAAHRTPAWRRTALRGPGRWLPIAESVAFRAPPRPRGAFLDVSTRAGKAGLLVSLAAVLGAAAVLYDTSPLRAELVAFDAVALLAVFGTGRLAELQPDPATAPARFLGDVARRIRKACPAGEVRLVGRIRVPDGSAQPDELRLAASPRSAPPGTGVEVGVVYVPGAGGAIALPGVILRLAAGGAEGRTVARLARHGRSAPGRRRGERAVLFAPRIPSARHTAALAVRLLRALAEARAGRAGGDVAGTRRAA
jgi:hypothetical protein